jgi:CRP-like cAMP-binding protein
MNFSTLIQLAEKELVLERNECLYYHNVVDTNIYYVESGSLKMFVIDNDSEQIIRFGYQHNLLVFLDSFISGNPSVFHMQALKKTKLKIISKAQLNHFLKISADHELLWTKILEDLVLQQMDREIDLLTSSPLERYIRVIQRSPKLFQEIPHRHIANYLRMTPETLSRIKAQMQKS